MSEYQYYEFQAVDRPLDAKAQAELRAISTRARITSTGFVNSYEWGGLKADPLDLLARHFDLFLYLANWNTRRFAMRVPRRQVDVQALKSFGLDDEWVSIERRGEFVIIDICRDEVEAEDWEDGDGRLAALAPLRAALIGGDHSLFLLLWLIEVDMGWAADDATMPMPSPGHMSAPLAALADFLDVDRDLLAVAFGDDATAEVNDPSPEQVTKFIRDLSDVERTDLLLRLHAGDDPHLSAELRRRCHQALGHHGGPKHSDGRRLTAGDLRREARRKAEAGQRETAERTMTERRRREAEEAAARARHLDALARRGDAVWREVEELIEQRNANGYDRATALLIDLREISAWSGQDDTTVRRVAELGRRHAKKGQLIQRLTAAGLLRP